MPGAISGALAAVLGARAGRYAALKEEYREEVVHRVADAMAGVIFKELESLSDDLHLLMNVEKYASEEQRDIYKVELKRDAANKLISKTRFAISRELHELFSNLS